jgi:hypothetical protein
MIIIKRLVGESYDFETGREINKGLVLSNGVSERTVEATPEMIQAVLSLFSEQAEAVAQRHAPTPQNTKKPAQPQRAAPQRNGQAHSVEHQDGLEPGEGYEDEFGTSSV